MQNNVLESSPTSTLVLGSNVAFFRWFERVTESHGAKGLRGCYHEQNATHANMIHASVRSGSLDNYSSVYGCQADLEEANLNVTCCGTHG